jgi:hypothetical protein
VEALHTSTVQFNQDRDGLYGALKLAMINSPQGQEHIAAHELATDGVSLWILPKAKYNNDQNIEHKIMILKTTYDMDYHDKYRGGLLGFLSRVATRYNVMDNADPKFLLHTHKTHHQKMILVCNQLARSK